MRAVLVLSVSVASLLDVLTALPIGRAECEKPKEVTAIAATNKAEETSKTKSVETGSTLSSEAQSKVGDEPSVDASKQISATETERLVGSTFVDEDQLWGDRVNWSQLKSHPTTLHPIIEEPLIASFFVPERNQTDVTTNWIASSQQDRSAAGKAYHEAARQVDAIASDLEEARLYSDADAVRIMTQKLRVRARMLPWDEREKNGQFFRQSRAIRIVEIRPVVACRA